MFPFRSSAEALPSACPQISALLCALGLLIAETQAADYFVSPSGSDGNPGTEAAPFATIQHAINTVPTSSRVVLRAGVYREAVKIWRSGLGAPGAPFVLEAFADANGLEEVTISGFSVVVPNQNGNGPWEVHSGNIFKIQLDPLVGLGPGETSILVDGQPMIQAPKRPYCASARW